MIRYLLDVNVLIALIDPAHVRHNRAHDWFAEKGNRAWATCPLTQNGVLRIVGHHRYPNSPSNPAEVAFLMATFLSHNGHEFWPDSVSLFDKARIDRTRLLDSGQVTDSYLLALARAHNGKLATFDNRIVTSAVIGGMQALHRID